MAARAELLGLSGKQLPQIAKVRVPKSPVALTSWMFEVAMGSAINSTVVLSKPNDDSATAAATFALLGYASEASRAEPKK